MNSSTPGLPVHHQLPESTQTHVHQVDDAIQPFHPLLSPSSSALNSFPASGSFPMSQLFTSGSQSIGASALALVLPESIQGWFPLGLTGLISCCPRDSQESSPTPQFESNSSLVLSLLYDPTLISVQFSSAQFSHSVMSNSLRPREQQQARSPCPSPTPGVHPNPCSSSRWCHPTISSSVIPFSSCPQSFPASGSFPMSQIFTLCGQSIGVSASTSVLPMKRDCWKNHSFDYIDLFRQSDVSAF